MIAYRDYNLLDSKSLSLFVLLAEELHFGRTAARLGVAQSVVSTHLKRLEDLLGAKLVSRGRRSAVRLTPTGQTFLAEARAVLDQLRKAEQIGRLAGRGEAGDVSVGYVFSAAVSGLLTTSLKSIRAAMPALVVTAEPMETPRQIAAISSGMLDLGFIRPRPIYPENVEAEIIHWDMLVLALPATHPLAAEERIDPATLAAERFIVPHFGEPSGLSDSVRSLARLGDFRPLPFVETRDFVTAISLVGAGQGISLIPRSVSRLRLEGVCFREIAGELDQVELALIWRRGGSERLASIILENPMP